MNAVLDTDAFAAGGKVTDPTGVAPDRYVYYPGMESLAPDEMRIDACGLTSRVFLGNQRTLEGARRLNS